METAVAASGAAARLAPDERLVPGSDRGRPVLPAVEEFLNLLARALHQHRAYPAGSPLCRDAISAAHRALLSCGSDHLVLRVTPDEVFAGDTGIGKGTIVGQELAQGLHRARVSAVAIDLTATPRDLSWFCRDLVGSDRGKRTGPTLAEMLIEHGVDTIVPQMAPRPEVVSLGMPPSSLCEMLDYERSRRKDAEASGPAAYLYPPDRGWVRLDPASPLRDVSLVDLAILLDDPNRLARVLLHLTDDWDGEESAAESDKTALERKFSDVARLLSSIEPGLARRMFQKLARAVLDLEPERRQALLRRTILPGLLDARAEGAVLNDFPDVDLAQALCLLLDLETASPEVLSTALDRMNLSAARRQAVVPLLEAEIEARSGRLARQREPLDPDTKEPASVRYARKLVRIDVATCDKSFADFAAFDLSFDDKAIEAIADIREEVCSTDVVKEQLRCLIQLVRLEPNPDAVAGFLARGSNLLAGLWKRSRFAEVVSWLEEARRLAGDVRRKRPDVTEAIECALARFCTAERSRDVIELYESGGEGRTAAESFVTACGGAAVPSFVALLGDAESQPRTRALVQLMSDHAKLLAPALAAGLGEMDRARARLVVRVLGHAGPGYEPQIASLAADEEDEAAVREALRALSRVGSARAASLIAERLREGGDRTRAAAEEALWRLRPAHAEEQVRDLLGRREFVQRHPAVALRLLERASQAGFSNLGRVATTLAPLRYRFWNRALARVGSKAREMAAR